MCFSSDNIRCGSRHTLETLTRLLIVTLVVIYASACNPESLDPDPNAMPGFSTDTVTFDTVFSTIGSATLSVRVYNTSNRPMLISSIELAGGVSSFFRLNIDGEPVSLSRDVEIPPKDSLFIFVAVTVDPTHADNPVVIKDSIVFLTNGKLSDVKLIAYGQDVHLINGDILETQTWTNDKPYLIYHSMAVDTGSVLTVEAGTQVYFHRNSSLIVWGTLLVNGTADDPVVFQNDRLEEFYDIVPGQWGTIYIDPISRGNKINHAVIKNAIAGLQVGYPADYRVPELELSNTYIVNTSFAGIYAFGAELLCYNTIIANSAGPATALLRGGNYRFLHCTLNSQQVPGTSRTSPAVVLTNVFYNPEYDEGLDEYVYVPRAGDLQQALFANCIIYGSFANEFQRVNNNTNLFEYRFDHCLLRAVEDSVKEAVPLHFNALVLNEDPAFVNATDHYHLDYNLDTLSPAKDSGDMQWLTAYPFLETDKDGRLRTGDGNPDLGALERKEE